MQAQSSFQATRVWFVTSSSGHFIDALQSVITFEQLKEFADNAEAFAKKRKVNTSDTWLAMNKLLPIMRRICVRLQGRLFFFVTVLFLHLRLIGIIRCSVWKHSEIWHTSALNLKR